MEFIQSFLIKKLLPYAVIASFFYLLLAVIPQKLLLTYQIQIAQSIVNFSTNPIFNIRFNYIGFFIPLIFSITILIFGITTRRYKFSRIDIALVLSFILFGFLSVYFKVVMIRQNGASLDAPLVVFTMFLFSLILYLKRYDTALLYAYPIGFACGLVSDVISTGAFKVGVYGGFGFFDGDFVLPLAFFLTTYIFYKRNLRTNK